MPATEREQPATRRRGGPPPFGWEWIGGKLSPVPTEQHIRWLIFHLSSEGWSVRRIAAHLRELHIYNRGQSWSYVAVHRLLVANVAAPG